MVCEKHAPDQTLIAHAPTPTYSHILWQCLGDTRKLQKDRNNMEEQPDYVNTPCIPLYRCRWIRIFDLSQIFTPLPDTVLPEICASTTHHSKEKNSESCSTTIPSQIYSQNSEIVQTPVFLCLILALIKSSL